MKYKIGNVEYRRKGELTTDEIDSIDDDIDKLRIKYGLDLEEFCSITIDYFTYMNTPMERYEEERNKFPI